jgi:acyl-homoserine lactone synthase
MEARMIHLIQTSNRHLYPRELTELHRERHRQFIIERGWGLRTIDGGEYDAYDDDRAFHLVGFSPDGEIDVGCRIRPTVDGGVLPDVFPHLIADTELPIRASGVFECTRYFTTARARGRQGFESRSKLHVAMLELMRDQDGRRLLGFVDLPLLTHLRRFSGLRIHPVGFPTPYDDGGVTIAFEIGVEAEDLLATRRKLAIPTRQLFVAPSWLPPGADVLALAQTTATLLNASEERRSALKTLAREAVREVVFQPDVEGLMAELARAAA